MTSAHASERHLAPRWAGAVFVAVTGILGAVAAWSLAREAWTTGVATPLAALTDTLDERVERAVHDPDLYRAIVDGTPTGARIFFLGDESDAATHYAYNETEPLVFPRRFFRVAGIPEGWTPGDVGAEAHVHAIAYGPFREIDLGAFFELVSEGPAYRLWRLREEGR